MLRLASIVLLVALLQTVVGKTAVWVWFKANESYIAQNLCENKAKPMKKCNGKCHLAKQLKKAEGETKHSPTLPTGLKEIKEAEPESISNIGISALVLSNKANQTFVYKTSVSADYSSSLLRPPIG